MKVGSLLLLVLLGIEVSFCGAASADERAAPPGWAGLDLRLDAPGATVDVDTGHFCVLPCRMLLAPGAHAFVISGPDLEPQTFRRTFGEGSSLVLDGRLEEGPVDAAGAVLFALGGAAVLTAIALVSWNLVTYAEGSDDWDLSYAAAGLLAGGVVLGTWGGVRGSTDEQPAGITESVVPR